MFRFVWTSFTNPAASGRGTHAWATRRTGGEIVGEVGAAITTAAYLAIVNNAYNEVPQSTIRGRGNINARLY